MASLHVSGAWRRYESYLAGIAPSDIWREGCWRFVTYRAVMDDRHVDIVFSVYLQARRPPVRAAIVDAAEATNSDPHVMVPAPRRVPELSQATLRHVPGRIPTFTPVAPIRARPAFPAALTQTTPPPQQRHVPTPVPTAPSQAMPLHARMPRHAPVHHGSAFHRHWLQFCFSSADSRRREHFFRGPYARGSPNACV